MKLAFIWWWDKAEPTYPLWRDGLRAAIEVIGKDNDVDVVLGEFIPEEEYDAYLIWGDSNCPAIDLIKDRTGKKGIILTTDPHNIDNLRKLDIVFCESKPVYEEVRKYGIRAVRAFGTDTDFFIPNDSVERDIPYFYPATFSPWKNQKSIAYLGPKLWCVGTVQPDGKEELQACKDHGVHTAEGYYKVEHIRDLYQRTKHMIIPAIHGSERTVLEAMSCGILPSVNPQNKRTHSYVDEYEILRGGVREFVVTHYNATQYAEKILRGLS